MIASAVEPTVNPSVGHIIEEPQDDTIANSISMTSALNLKDTDLSSVNSSSVTDSPEGTTISSHGSSFSSLSGFTLKAPIYMNQAIRGSEKVRLGNSQSSVTGYTSIDLNQAIKNEYMALINHCHKFSSRHNAAKSNYLRLTILPFLRENRASVPVSESSIQVEALTIWWSQILEVIKSNFRHINGVDRNLYYEVISSLIARPEWQGHRNKHVYRQLVEETIIHVLHKCTLARTLTVAQAAFTGKVLAYSYFFLPNFASYLLRIMSNDRRATQKFARGHKVDCDLPRIAERDHLINLVNIMTLPKEFNVTEKLKWLPPQCWGWNRHFVVDSVVFASFFKHFCSLQSEYLSIEPPLVHEDGEFMDGDRSELLKSLETSTKLLEDRLLASPGMLIVLAYILDSYRQVLRSYSKSKPPVAVGDSNAFSRNYERVRIDHLKIFGAFREILHSDEYTVSYFLVYSRVFDRIFKALASGTRVYEVEGCVTTCNIVEEWISSVFAIKYSRIQCMMTSCYKHLAIDWDFWLSVVKRMLKSDNSHTEIRALSFLFNVWPHLPNYETPTHEENHSPGILRKTTEWILSIPMWFQLFCHWCPLVRSYYHRLLCFRVASVGVGTSAWFLDEESAQVLEESRGLLANMLAYTYMWCQLLNRRENISLETEPSLPLPRLRVAIKRVGPLHSSTNYAKVETNISRAYPFDIFDTAAYWNLNNSTKNQEVGDIATEGHRTSSSQLRRSMSILSKRSSGSATSVGSNSSVMSSISVQTVRSKMKRLSASLRKKDQPPVPENNIGIGSKQTAKAESRRIWNLWGRKDSKKIPTEGSANINSKDIKVEYPQEPTYETSGRDNHHTSHDFIASPEALLQPRPDIERPTFRFIMVPTNVKPPSTAMLTVPRLPFDQQIETEKEVQALEDRAIGNDLAVWNYGGRSLAEWNLEVKFFEEFAMQQRRMVDDSMEVFSMPFLVAEIPWRVLG